MPIQNDSKPGLSSEQRALRKLHLFFLCKIYRKANSLIFKGGTALDIFYGSGRFSEDLNFDCGDLNGLSEIDDAIEAFGNDGEYSVLNDWGGEREMHKSFTRHVLRISNKDSGKLLDLAIDYTVDAPKYEPDKLPLKCGKSLASASVMQEKEILAEKAAAIMGREKARDLYDLYFLAVVKGVHVNITDVYEKCAKEFAGKKTEYSFPLFRERVMALKPRWKELKPLLGNAEPYRFDDVAASVLDIFRSI